MPRIVFDSMNSEVLKIAPERRVADVARELVDRNLSAAPVIDTYGYPQGMVSLRQLVVAEGHKRVEEVMNTPPVVVDSATSLALAGRMLASAGLHRLIVVDELGRAEGIISAIDVVRGLAGLKATHPWPFPYQQGGPPLEWTADRPLTLENVAEFAPDATGVLVIFRQVGPLPEVVVWAESSRNVRVRLRSILTLKQPDPLGRLLIREDLRFRAVESKYRAVRERALRDLTGEHHAVS